MRFSNVGTVDRIIRLFLGLGLVIMPFVVSSMALPRLPGIIALVVGGILILTAIVTFCPIYGVLGLRTKP